MYNLIAAEAVYQSQSSSPRQLCCLGKGRLERNELIHYPPSSAGDRSMKAGRIRPLSSVS